MTTYHTEHESPLGPLLLATTERGICGLYFEQHKYFSLPSDWKHDPLHPHLQRAKLQLDEYFIGRRTAFDVPLDLQGTSFQRAIWSALLSLPYGTTTSYQALATSIDKPQAVRATGTAIGRNPVSIIVPCHRVLGVSGALSGYAGGLERKRFLLAFEAEASSEGEMETERWRPPASAGAST